MHSLGRHEGQPAALYQSTTVWSTDWTGSEAELHSGSTVINWQLRGLGLWHFALSVCVITDRNNFLLTTSESTLI